MGDYNADNSADILSAGNLSVGRPSGLYEFETSGFGNGVPTESYERQQVFELQSGLDPL